MEYQVKTRDHYLRYALKDILPVTVSKKKVYIIDLASFHTLGELRACVKHCGENGRYIFIGDERIYSRLLRPLISLSRKMSLNEYRKIRHYPGLSYETVSRSLDRHLCMDGFTHKENSTVYSLLIHDSFISAAKYIGINPKSFYQRVNKLSKKLNISSRLQTQLYFRREFQPDSVQHRINEQVRQAFRMN